MIWSTSFPSVSWGWGLCWPLLISYQYSEGKIRGTQYIHIDWINEHISWQCLFTQSFVPKPKIAQLLTRPQSLTFKSFHLLSFSPSTHTSTLHSDFMTCSSLTWQVFGTWSSVHSPTSWLLFAWFLSVHIPLILLQQSMSPLYTVRTDLSQIPGRNRSTL